MRKHILISISVLFCTLIFSPAGADTHIMIDPGHGGNDSGAVRGPAREADIALKVAKILKELLEQDPDFKTSLTRDRDAHLSLQERVHLAEKAKADIFVSLHANASSDRRAKGAEFYFQNHLPPDEETLFLAASENQATKSSLPTMELEPSKKNDIVAIVEDLRRQHRMRSSHQLSRQLLKAWSSQETNAIRQAPFYVVSKTSMPSVLVELGFITNPKEAERLLNVDYQKDVAQKIYAGLRKFKEIMDKSESIPLESTHAY